METIQFAAIRYELLSERGDFKHVIGANHGQCIEALSFMDIPRSDRNLDMEVQGFMTSLGRFVDRSEAYKIAEKAGQLIRENPNGTLDSYNLKVCSACKRSDQLSINDVAFCNCCERFCFYEGRL